MYGTGWYERDWIGWLVTLFFTYIFKRTRERPNRSRKLRNSSQLNDEIERLKS